ncbi:MAG: hypothetical protein EF813_02595 [Methanosarcinales archaeon]|nr:MAG: hypothetical protein EF813_02595 [Methanosarcinales archaeon]
MALIRITWRIQCGYAFVPAKGSLTSRSSGEGEISGDNYRIGVIFLTAPEEIKKTLTAFAP